MLTPSLAGARCFIQGMGLLTRPGIRRFVLIPLSINIAVFVLLFAVLAGQFGELIDWLMPELPAWLGWLSYLLWLLFAVLAGIVLFFSFSLLANIIASPFNAVLAEAVERHLTNREPPSGGGIVQAIREAPAAVMDELRKVLYYVTWAIPFLLLFLVPGVNLLAPFAWALFSAWMLAVQYCDFPLGNHGLKFSEQRARLRQRRGLAYGFGAMSLLATLIPVFNFLVMPAAVAGATALVTRHLDFTPESR